MDGVLRWLERAVGGMSRTARRRLDARAAVACEALEGRQLLSFGGWGGPGFGGWGQAADIGGLMGGAAGPMLMPMKGHLGHGFERGGKLGGPSAGVQGVGTMTARTAGPEALGLGFGPAELGGLPLSALGNTADLAGPGAGLHVVRFHAHGPGGAPSAAVQAAFQTLGTDMDNLAAGSQVTLGQQHALSKDARAVLKAETAAPNATQVTTLNNDLRTAVADGLTAADLAKVQADQAIVLQGAGVPQATITKLQADALAVFRASGITGAEIQTLQADQQAVQTAISALASTTTTSTSSTSTGSTTPSTSTSS